MTARIVASTGSKRCASTGSPRAPIASEVSVTPSCIAEMNRGGSPVIRSTARARRFPSRSSSRMRVRREVTSPYSAATKNAFRRISATSASSSSPRLMLVRRAAGWRPPVREPVASEPATHPSWRRRRRRGSRRKVVQAPAIVANAAVVPADANICSILRRCGSSTARSRARSALNRVKGMPFHWSLNPYMGCAHRCTFCYVRAFERRADRPSDARYGTSIRVKTNVAEVLRCELARPSWRGEGVAIGAATDPYQPCEGRFRLTRGCLEVLAAAANPFALITRGPMIVRDLDVLSEAASARRRLGHVLGADRRRGGLAPDRARHRAAAPATAGARAAGRRRHQGVGRDGADPARHLRRARAARGGRAGRAGGGRVRDLGRRAAPEARHAGALPRVPRRGLAGARCPSTSGSTAAAPTSPTPRSSRSARRCGGSPGPTASATAAGHRSTPPPAPEQLTLGV